MVEITTTNIVAKNRFKELFEAEERKVVENTNRIFDIERYLDRHPELANEGLKRQLEEFRTIRVRYEARARKDNVKRDDISEMTRAMQAVMAQFDPASKRPLQPKSIEATVSSTARTAAHKVQPLDEEVFPTDIKKLTKR